LAVEDVETDLFEQRARWLLVDNKCGKNVVIRIGDRTFPLEPSVADGHFFGTLRLETEFVDAVAKNGRVRFAAVTGQGDSRKFEGSIHRIQPEGMSVISDIDDTIKVSEVGNRPQLLKNTFLRPFRAVTGMADAYRRWSGDGVEFHFVSASPWQLYVPLATFADAARFPSATYHLKRVRFKDETVLPLFANPVNLKLDMIREILGDFPKRRFILVGDSGERDPEVYGQLARDFPEQIQRIYIRDVAGDQEDGQRYEDAFACVPSDMWCVFQDAAMLVDD
jgi:phosphatidate phosphatase APP1